MFFIQLLFCIVKRIVPIAQEVVQSSWINRIFCFPAVLCCLDEIILPWHVGTAVVFLLVMPEAEHSGK